MGVAERRNQAGFVPEALDKALIAGPIRADNFDGDFAIHRHLPRTIDRSHAAPTEQRPDFILTQAACSWTCHTNVRLLQCMPRKALTRGGIFSRLSQDDFTRLSV